MVVTNDDLVYNLERRDKWNEEDMKVNIRTFPLLNKSLCIFLNTWFGYSKYFNVLSYCQYYKNM